MGKPSPQTLDGGSLMGQMSEVVFQLISNKTWPCSAKEVWVTHIYVSRIPGQVVWRSRYGHVVIILPVEIPQVLQGFG